MFSYFLEQTFIQLQPWKDFSTSPYNKPNFKRLAQIVKGHYCTVSVTAEQRMEAQIICKFIHHKAIWITTLQKSVTIDCYFVSFSFSEELRGPLKIPSYTCL